MTIMDDSAKIDVRAGSSTRRGVAIALAAGSIALGAQIDVPFVPVPFSLQTLFVVLAGLLLGARDAAVAVVVYAVAGMAGLPVLAGGAAGVERFLGPTGGYLVGFLPLAVLAARARRGDPPRVSWAHGFLWGALGHAMLFACGVSWLAVVRSLSAAEALRLGMVPFLPGALFKLIAAIGIARLLLRSGRS